MLEWLIPVSAYWTVSALYLGGMGVDLRGGNGLKQVLGLLGGMVLFVVVWGVLRLVLGGFMGFIGRAAIPTVVTILLLPWIMRAVYLPLGVRLEKVAGEH